MRALLVLVVLALAAGCGDAFEQADATARVATEEGGIDGKQETDAPDAEADAHTEADVPDVSRGSGGVAGGAGSAGLFDASDAGESETGEADAGEADASEADAGKADASALTCPSAACTAWCASLEKVDTCQAGACVCMP